MHDFVLTKFLSLFVNGSNLPLICYERPCSKHEEEERGKERGRRRREEEESDPKRERERTRW